MGKATGFDKGWLRLAVATALVHGLIVSNAFPPTTPNQPPSEKMRETGCFEYILPHTPSNDREETFVTIINPWSTRVAHTVVRGWDGEGGLVGELAFSLLAWNKQRPGLKAWFGAEASRVAWLEVYADLPLHVFAEVEGEETSAAYMASSGPEDRLFLPHVAKNTNRFATYLAAVHDQLSEQPIQILTQPEGQTFPFPVSHQGPQHFHGDVRELLGDDLSGVDWAQLLGSGADPGEGVAAMEYFTVLPEETQLAALGLNDRSGHILRFAHIAKDVGQFWTGLVYINPGDLPANLAETYYDDQGALLLRRERQLAAGAKVDPIPLFDQNQQEPAGAAWLEVTSDQPLLGYELFGAPLNSGHDYFAGLRGNLETARIIDYPYLLFGENAFTGLVAVNTGEEAADLFFTAIAADGSVVARAEPPLRVAPKSKVVRLARDLFSDQDLIRAAWFRAAGPEPVWTGFLLWGDTAPPRRKLAAIEAVAASDESPPIVLDEVFADWDTRPPAHRDAPDDAGGGAADFSALWVDHDDRYLFLRFEVGAELLLQSGSGVQLLVDSDCKRITGMPAHGLGAELEFRFGEGAGAVMLNGQTTTIGPYDLQLASSPTVSSRQFELAIRLDSQIGGAALFPNEEIKILLRSGEDLLPDESGGLSYRIEPRTPVPPPAFSIARRDSGHLRVLSYNVGVHGIFEAALAPAYTRLLQAIQPDIIGFQEIYFPNTQLTADLVEQFLPSGPGETWHHASANNSDAVAVSRFPIKSVYPLMSNSAFLLDLRPRFDTDLLLLVAHPPCCGDDAGRQVEFDAMMAFIREAKQPGGTLTLARGTPIMVVGDMNLVGDSAQQRTLLQGDIVDQAMFGPDFDPDWNGDRLADAKPNTTGAPMSFTWYNEASSFSPGRLDYVTYTASVLAKRNAFALFSPGLNAEELATHGLHREDSLMASDHLPVVVDFEWNPLEASADKTIAAGANPPRRGE